MKRLPEIQPFIEINITDLFPDAFLRVFHDHLFEVLKGVLLYWQ